MPSKPFQPEEVFQWGQEAIPGECDSIDCITRRANEKIATLLAPLRELVEEQKKYREGHPVDVYFGQYEELLAAVQKVIE